MEKFHRKMDAIQLHAALEIAGILKNNPGVISASIGPNILYPHTINECVEIKSIMYIYNLLQEVLKSLK
jgi:di/tripeptidase